MRDAGPVRISLAFQGNKRLAEYARLAGAAESFGFDAVSMFGDLFYQPPLPGLLAMAGATSRISLGPACLNPFTLHPVEIAGQIAALDRASEGRAYLGLARGSWLRMLGIDQRGGAEAVGEAAAVVLALLARDTEGIIGTRFGLPAGACLQDAPLRSRVPILIGTWGPRLAAIAGEVADWVKVGGSANPRLLPLVRAWVDRGILRAGRDPNCVGLVVGAVTVVAEDGDTARRRAREEVAMYLEVVGRLDPTTEVPEDLLAKIGRLLRENDREGAGRLIPRDLLDRFAFAGRPNEITEHAIALLDAGADGIEFGTPHGLSDGEGVRLLGSRVLPELRLDRDGL
jgi:5,10-methylenetetrahydromethanopterin reductase